MCRYTLLVSEMETWKDGGGRGGAGRGILLSVGEKSRRWNEALRGANDRESEGK